MLQITLMFCIIGCVTSIGQGKLVLSCPSSVLSFPSDSAYHVAIETYWGSGSFINSVAPVFAVNAGCEKDVGLTLRFALENGFQVVPKANGHGPINGDFNNNTATILLKLSAMSSVTIEDGKAIVSGSVTWEDVYQATSPLGLIAVGGDCPTVSTAGYLQQGGFGMAARLFGVASDSVISFRVTLANGTTLTASAQEATDLYWALRGGGSFGSFGIVVGTTLQLRKAPRRDGRFSIAQYCWSRLLNWSEALDAYLEWREQNTGDKFYYDTGNLNTAGFCINAAHFGENGEAVLKDMRRFGSFPLLSSVNGNATQLDFGRLIPSIPKGVINSYFASVFLSGCAMESASIKIGGEFSAKHSLHGSVMWHTLGGATQNTTIDAAFPYRNATMLLGVSALGFFQEDLMSWIETIQPYTALIRSRGGFGAYANFADVSYSREEAVHMYFGANAARLQQVKLRYDASDFFHCAQCVPLSSIQS